MERNLSLHDLVAEVIAAIQEVDEHVLSSAYVKSTLLKLEPGINANGYDYTDPEAHLEDFDDIYFWENYFEFVLEEWNLDQHGERMSESKFNFIIERLTTAASRLDRFGPQLVNMYQEIPNVPERRIQGIVRRRTVLNSFLNSAEIGLEHYYRSDDFINTRTLRQRRPIPVVDQVAPPQSEKSIRSPRPTTDEPGNRSLTLLGVLGNISTNNSTLVVLTTLVTVASAIIQAYGYSIAKHEHGSWNSADFFSTLQNVLMQLLSLYITLLPAIRHRSVHNSYQRWSWALAGLAVVSPILAIGFFYYSPAVSQLILFLGSATQSTIILELIWAVDQIADMKVKRETQNE